MSEQGKSAQASALLPERRALLATLFEDRVATAVQDPENERAVAFPEEEAAVAGSSRLRLLEFRNGRVCAHAALSSLGVDAAPVLRGRNREPIWPPAVVGSITHTVGFCAAAVALREHYCAIGFDAEIDHSASSKFAHRVCSARELERFAYVDEEAERLATVVFSVKETIHKLQYPLTGAVLYWRDLEVLLDAERFSARLLASCPPFRTGHQFGGRWLRGSGLVLTGAALASGAFQMSTS